MDQEPKKEEWDLSKVGKIKEKSIGAGGDSGVFRVTNPQKNIDAVVKTYAGKSFTKIPKEKQLEIFEKYYSDTQKAREFLEENSNPLNQTIVIGGEKIVFSYEIPQQGGIILDKDKHVQDLYTGNIKGVKSVFGQKHIDGLNLSTLSTLTQYLIEQNPKIEVPKAQEVFVGKYFLVSELRMKIVELFTHLSKKLGVHFTLAMMNVKPFYDQKEKKIKIIITDLASSLTDTYK